MSQYKAGTASVTNGSARVNGSGTAWLSEVEPGDYFVVRFVEGSIEDGGIVYEVGGVVSDTAIDLTAPYGGATRSGVGYVIHRDFQPNGLPKVFPTDLETAAIFNKHALLLGNRTLGGTESTAGILKISTLAAAIAGTNENTAMAPDLVHAAFNQYGLGELKDLRNNVLETGTPSDLYGTGTRIGLARGGSDGLGIPNLGTNHYGVLAANGHWSDSSGLGGVNRLFLTNGFIYTQKSIDDTTWGTWLKGFNTGNVATKAESQDGAIDNKPMTPLRTHEAFNRFGLGFGAIDLSDFTINEANKGRIFRALAGAPGGPGVVVGGVSLPMDGTPTTNYLAVNSQNIAFIGSKVGINANPSWQKLFSQGNILGTVSQSSGVPTGAIIERGSNSNGEYVKFADGTMICTHILTTVPLSTGVYNATDVTFPAGFSSSPDSVVVTGRAYISNTTFLYHDSEAYAATTCKIVTITGAEASNGLNVTYTAIGRWF